MWRRAAMLLPMGAWPGLDERSDGSPGFRARPLQPRPTCRGIPFFKIGRHGLTVVGGAVPTVFVPAVRSRRRRGLTASGSPEILIGLNCLRFIRHGANNVANEIPSRAARHSSGVPLASRRPSSPGFFVDSLHTAMARSPGPSHPILILKRAMALFVTAAPLDRCSLKRENKGVENNCRGLEQPAAPGDLFNRSLCAAGFFMRKTCELGIKEQGVGNAEPHRQR